MSGNSNHPVPVSAGPVDDMREPSEIANWAPSGEGPRQDVGPKIQRYVSALYRFKWLILLMTVLGAAGGYVATGFIVPQYQVDSTISMGLDANINAARGQDDGLMDRDSWQDLLKTFRVADPVVTKLALYLVPKKDRDSTAFRDFQVSSALVPGEYTLKTQGRTYKLLASSGLSVDSGAVGDSIGRRQGFMWAPSQQDLAGHPEMVFNVRTPRDASVELINNLHAESTLHVSEIAPGRQESGTACCDAECLDRAVRC